MTIDPKLLERAKAVLSAKDPELPEALDLMMLAGEQPDAARPFDPQTGDLGIGYLQLVIDLLSYMNNIPLAHTLGGVVLADQLNLWRQRRKQAAASAAPAARDEHDKLVDEIVEDFSRDRV